MNNSDYDNKPIEFHKDNRRNHRPHYTPLSDDRFSSNYSPTASPHYRHDRDRYDQGYRDGYHDGRFGYPSRYR